MTVNAGNTSIGSIKVLPPTLLLQYHFDGLPVKPYVGAGINYTNFSGVSLPAGVTINNSSWGGALQAGVDIPLKDKLIVTVDWNGQQIDGPTAEVMSLGNLPAKWEAFGWDVRVLDHGNSMEAVLAALEEAKARSGQGKPVVILMRTEMGYGVDFMQGTHKWHGKAPNQEQFEAAMGQLEETALGDF